MALPANGSTHLIPAYYSFYRQRKDERLSWPSWLTYSGWITHISGHPSAAGRAQDRESSPARDRRSTTVPRQPTSHKMLYNAIFACVDLTFIITSTFLLKLLIGLYIFEHSQTIYDTRCYFNVRSKADISQLNLPDGSLICLILNVAAVNGRPIN